MRDVSHGKGEKGTALENQRSVVMSSAGGSSRMCTIRHKRESQTRRAEVLKRLGRDFR